MSLDNILNFMKKWEELIGFLAAVAGLVSIFTGTYIIACVLIFIAWLFISLWLWGILRQKNAIKKAILEGTPPPSPIYTDNQRRAAQWVIPFVFVLAISLIVYLILLNSNILSIERVPAPQQSTPTETISQTFTPSPSSTFTPTNTHTLTFTPTYTETDTPTFTYSPTPTPDYSFGINRGCLDARYWALYQPEGIVPDNNNCWSLANIGFIVQDEKIYINLPLSTEERSRAIYLPIGLNTEISFNIQITKIYTDYRQAWIRIGVVPANPPDPSNGKFLAYRFMPKNYINAVPYFMPGGSFDLGYALNPVLKIDNVSTQTVDISTKGHLFSISINGQSLVPEPGKEIGLGYDNRLLWVEYSLPPNIELFANITNFVIKSK